MAELGKFGVDQVAGFSSLGPATDGRIKPDLLAPGAFEWSLAPAVGSAEGQLFQLFGGTSQATPMAAAVAALVWQAFQQARGRAPTPDELQRLLASTADDLCYPPGWQGAGRLNALRAVQAALGKDPGPLVEAHDGAHAILAPGESRTFSVTVRNQGDGPLAVAAAATVLVPDPARSLQVVGRLTAAEPVQDLPLAVPPGCDLLQVTLAWTGAGPDGRAPRGVVALFDPDGNFVNYQRPNTLGEPEWGRMAEATAARPRPGTWTARLILRPPAYPGVLPYTLTAAFLRRQPWPWVRPAPEPVAIPPGQAAAVPFTVAVPAGAPAGHHAARLELAAGDRTVVLPLAVSVPIAVRDGAGAFAGTFQHGRQDTFMSGDWRTYYFRVPPGVRTVTAAVHWPDPGHGVEFYAVDPDGNTVVGKSNGEAAGRGQPGVQGHELVLTRPRPGLWQLILHAVACTGRGEPEPFSGALLYGPDLAEPREVRLVATPGARIPIALGVRNPGRVPVEVYVRGRTRGLSVRTATIQTRVAVGQDPGGRGTGVTEVGPFSVPPEARLLGAFLSWDAPGVTVSLSLNDAVTGTTQSVAHGRDGLVMVLERNPAPGQWTVTVNADFPGDLREVSLHGAWLLHGPEELAGLSTRPTVLLPGRADLVHCWLESPADLQAPLLAELQVVSREGDQLAAVPLRVVPQGRPRAGTPPAAPGRRGQAAAGPEPA